MNFHVKINNIKYPIIQYSLRLNNVNNNTQISNRFTCTVLSDTAGISEGDTIEFYSNDILIYTDPINTIIENDYKFDISSDKTINIPVSKNNTIDTVLFHSTDRLRVPSDFDIIPLDTLSTPVGDFIATTTTHYDFTTEITI